MSGGRFRLLVLGLCVPFLAVGCERLLEAVGHFVPFTQVSGQQDVSAEVDTLVVRGRVGDIIVKSAESGSIQVEAEVKIAEDRAQTTDSGTFEDHVTISTADGTMTVADAHAGMDDEKDWQVAITVTAPKRLAVRVSSGVGEVTVRGFEGAVEIDSGVGDAQVGLAGSAPVSAHVGTGDIVVNLERAAGTVHMETGVGDLSVTVAEGSPQQDVTLKSGVGDVVLVIPRGSPGKFQLSSGVGSVNVGDGWDLKKTESTTSGKASGTVGEGGPTYSLESGVGSVTLK